MERIDRKFNILATSVEHGDSYTEMNSVLFLAKDKAFLPTLEFYHSECLLLGADERQIEAVELLIKRVRRFQLEHPTKVPDVDDTEKGRTIIAPNKP